MLNTNIAILNAIVACTMPFQPIIISTDTTDNIAAMKNSTSHHSTSHHSTSHHSTTATTASAVNITDVTSAEAASTTDVTSAETDSTVDVTTAEAASTTDVTSAEAVSTTDVISAETDSTVDVTTAEAVSTTDVISAETDSTVDVTTAQAVAVTTSQAVSITDFGAHSITEEGYETFDSSQAINKAIEYAAANNISKVDFDSGKYYAKNISLESNITYFSSQGAELIASSDIHIWNSVMTATNKTNITIQGLTINGNKSIVYGDGIKGSPLISFTTCSNIIVQNCYLYSSKYVAILFQESCNYITAKNNKIYDTDCGIATAQAASNYILFDGNEVYGSPEYQYSEPIGIYNNNTKGLAHDITITNNIVHDKSSASGILVMNATKVLIKGNTAYNCNYGINVGIDAYMTGTQVTVSNDINITENSIYDCSWGITGELNNSVISKNKLNNLKGNGIWLLTKNITSSIYNDTIINNTITNINSEGGQEPAIRLSNTSNCTVANNDVSDT